MAFDLVRWKAQAADRFAHAGEWLRRQRDESLPYLTYGALCGLSLWPLVEAAQKGELLPVMMALGGVAAGVGGNLIAEQVQRWKDRAQAPDEAELSAWVQQQAGADADLRVALDKILAELEAVPRTRAALDESERQGFTEALRAELTRLGNLPRFEAVLSGPVVIAAGERSVAGNDLSGAVIVPGDHNTVVVGVPSASDRAAAEAHTRYLTHLCRECNALPLGAMGAEESVDEEVTLERVYISLDTTATAPLSEEEKNKRADRSFGERGDSRPVSALEAAIQSPRLVLLGDPGGGKSTFVRQLLASTASCHLGRERPVPDELRSLLPILVILRDLTPALQALELEALPEDKRQTALAHLVRDHLVAALEALESPDFGRELLEKLSQGQCLLAFDGLDEVPDALRPRARQAIQAAIRYYSPQRVIITCRIRSYTGQAILPKVPTYTLAPFDQHKITDFCAAWYHAQRDLRRVEATQAEHKIADLQRAALSDKLRELSPNPMLLTTMAMIHQGEHGLPEERVRLYSLAVSVLLSRWQKWVIGRPEQEQVWGADLVALLKDETKLRRVAERLAYEAHRRGDADRAFSRGVALTILEAPEYLGNSGLAGRFLSYVDLRAGLLLGQGAGEGHPSTYIFPHRTFQEYLAGCYIVGLRDIGRELWERVRESADWQLAVHLGAEELHYNERRGDLTLAELAYRLCQESRDSPQLWRAALWSGQMAALLGRAAIERDDATPDGGPAYLRRLLPVLVAIVEGNQLTAPERADAGNVLARLGDSRAEVTTLEGMQFCYVPGGPFWMGSAEGDRDSFSTERPQHRQDVRHSYWIGRYPITVAQYRQFVEGSGHTPEDPGCLRGPDNHPVVLVTWHEMRAFCNWLATQWRSKGWLPEGWAVRLPSDAEWEKAARGGLEVPAEPCRRQPAAGWDVASISRQPNDDPRRSYPWGGKANPNLANYGDTGIGATSAVGCFPGGASPYGVEELSGNVWEWCATKWRDNYKDYQEDNDPEGDDVRVVRGGSFNVNARVVRCAARNRFNPGDRGFNIGFRMVVAPVS